MVNSQQQSVRQQSKEEQRKMGSNLELFATLVNAFWVAAWVRRDALSRGKRKDVARCWAVGTFLLMIVFLPLWLLTRPRRRRLEPQPVGRDRRPLWSDTAP